MEESSLLGAERGAAAAGAGAPTVARPTWLVFLLGALAGGFVVGAAGLAFVGGPEWNRRTGLCRATQVVAAASKRGLAALFATNDPGCGRSVNATPRHIRVSAAAAPRLRGVSASRPRRRRDSGARCT